ncbi:MAG: bifunctional D-glycero-beta-D-manno-heptose-7-phosphate kinase/D-glycero-beta-D-manno-heptose 1-phosphate adenylyltransferase HldE [Pseudomonadales bacterium]|nr:bifunctional D-glycero-beta-D-manno-heptose-7-phosphate kinase/D-glycero-beta-D-manno-heptose 1-phosphate adenylyltransferase HldE [Pseudomonadales bacterium]
MKLQMPDFSSARVVVVGDVMLDRYWTGSTARISPEAPVPVVRVLDIEDRPGGAANVALNMAALGARVNLLGLVGKDSNAEILRQKLDAAGVGCTFSCIESKPTITKLRVLSRHQQLLRMDFEQGFSPEEAMKLHHPLREALASADVLVISDYGKGSLAGYAAIMAMAREGDVPVLVDPKGQDFTRYHGAALLTPNMGEFEAVVGTVHSEQELQEKGQSLMEQLDMPALLVTRSEHGMTLLQRDGQAMHLPAQAREVFDVTGAGDTVISVLAAALAAGEPLPQAVALANIAAGVVVGKLGTYAISAAELTRAMAPVDRPEDGVLTLEQLLNAVAAVRAQGEHVVMTNGCFDILHAGHVSYLQQARAEGDRLIVAVNGDASIARLKGPGRPINPLDRRMAVLAGLKAVDWVVAFEEDTPENLLRRIQPDVLVKGGDYGLEGVVGAEIVKAYGGEVKVLGLVAGLSTTAVVDKIRG